MKKLNIQNKQNKIVIPKSLDKVIKDIVNESAKSCGYNKQHGVSIVLTDDDGILKFNREFRGVDAPTDVLSFTLMEEDPTDGTIYLGDIIISIETAYRQAKDYGHSVEREVAFLVSHGMFHLMGYDHKDEESLKIMVNNQEKVLSAMGFIRGSDDVYIQAALDAMKNSYSPYSGFKVGACLVTDNGKTYTGCNVENASYGASICAERTAALKAVSDGYRKFKAVYICGDSAKPVIPCGVCLQFLAEFASPGMKIVCCDRTGNIKKEVEFLKMLPYTFGGIDI